MMDEYNRPLSIEGRGEAEKLVAFFQNIHIDAAYASNYRRTARLQNKKVKHTYS